MKYNGQIIQGIFSLVSGVQYNAGDMFVVGGQLHVFTRDWKFSGRLENYIDSNGNPIGDLASNSESYITAHRYNPDTNQRGIESLITNRSLEYILRNIFDDESDTPIYVNSELDFFSSVLSIDHSGIWYYVIGDKTKTADDTHKFYVKTYKSKSLDENYSNIIFAEIIRFDLGFRIAGRLDEELFAVQSDKDSITKLHNMALTSFKSLKDLLNEYNRRVNKLNQLNKVVSISSSSDEYYTSDGLHVAYDLSSRKDNTGTVINPNKVVVNIFEYDKSEDSSPKYTSRDISFKELYDSKTGTESEVKIEVGDLNPDKFKYLITLQKVDDTIEAVINTENNYVSKFKAEIKVEYDEL